MVGIEDLPAPHLGGLARDAVIAGNHGGLADARDRAGRLRRPVAVDHQPRIALRDQMRVELLRQRIRHAGNADIPGDMPRQLALREPEIAETARDQPAVVVASQKERRAPGRVNFQNRRKILLIEQV